MMNSLEETHAGGRIDDPGPAHIGVDVGVMLGEGDQLILVGIVNVHEDEFGSGKVLEQWAKITGIAADAFEGHAAVTGIITGMQFYRKVVFRGFLHHIPEKMVLQGFQFHIGKGFGVFGKTFENRGDGFVGHIFKRERARIGALILDGNGAGA